MSWLVKFNDVGREKRSWSLEVHASPQESISLLRASVEQNGGLKTPASALRFSFDPDASVGYLVVGNAQVGQFTFFVDVAGDNALDADIFPLDEGGAREATAESIEGSLVRDAAKAVVYPFEQQPLDGPIVLAPLGAAEQSAARDRATHRAAIIRAAASFVRVVVACDELQAGCEPNDRAAKAVLDEYTETQEALVEAVQAAGGAEKILGGAL